MMIRAAVLFGVVVVVHFAFGAILAWLTHRPKVRWVYVACVVNTVLLTCVLLTIDQFREDGLTLYSVFFSGMMLWIASTAARMGTVSMQTIRAQANR
jgi:hypothetical protein